MLNLNLIKEKEEIKEIIIYIRKQEEEEEIIIEKKIFFKFTYFKKLIPFFFNFF